MNNLSQPSRKVQKGIEPTAITPWIHAIIGLVMAIVSFFPVTLAYMYISIFICDRLGGGNMNTDDFMGAFVCIIPILILSLALALFGGDLGYQKNHKYLGAIIGGFLGPVIVLFLLTVVILSGWLN